ncbi:MAG: transglycosylase domain-containing protein [Steroidobacteraceae bacterium]
MNLPPLRWLRVAAMSVIGLVLAAGFALACSFVYLAPSLPTTRSMHSKELTAPLRVYDRSGRLISQIGEERRIPVSYEEIPDLVRKAVLAAEDDRFFEHSGLDWMGVVRAMVKNVVSADVAGQGGSTITQQAARNMFLTLDKTARRKLAEVFVTYRMERDFSKEEILAVYLNVVAFGHRSRGIAAAAETYYNRHLDQLTLSQAATLVGVLPAPSRYNPITSPRSAEVRRNYVLGRMIKLGYIDEAQAAAARKETVATRGYAPLVDVNAPYVGEMGRQELVKLFGPSAVNAGYKIFTTIDGRLQMWANWGLRIGLMEYDRRHGYRGHLGKVQLPAGASAGDLDEMLTKFDSIGLLQPAVVTKVGNTSAEVHVRFGGTAMIDWKGLAWAQPVTKSGALGARPKKPADVVAVGDVVFVVTDNGGSAQLAQLPSAQSALIALDPNDGAVVSLVGGFDFHDNEFNRVTQAQRQPGSGFKPFIYSAALENGFTPASAILNLPLVEECHDEECWHPENSGGGFGGLMRFREALVQSLNLVSRRILHDIGMDAAIEHAGKFGFRKDSLPRNETLALGTQSVKPWEMAGAYAVFANGGFRVEPYLISRIEDSSGKVVFEAKPKIACAECELPVVAPLLVTEPAPETAGIPGTATRADPAAVPAAAAVPEAATPRSRIRDIDAPPALRAIVVTQGGPGYLPADRLAPRVISAQNAWLMSDIMHDVAVRGTGRRSQSLNRDDLGGKTGTSQNNRDNWFNGFNRNLVASVWVGFDDEKSLGESEEGSKTALPIWIYFMKEALRAVPSARLERPGGLIDLRVSKTSGVLADPLDSNAVYETFMVEHLPKGADGEAGGVPEAGGARGGGEPLF